MDRSSVTRLASPLILVDDGCRIETFRIRQLSIRKTNTWDRTNEMSTQLFFTNVPYNCSDGELKEWIESLGIETVAIRVIRDLVSGASPAFAYASLKHEAQIEEAVAALNGKRMRNQIIIVGQTAPRDAVA